MESAAPSTLSALTDCCCRKAAEMAENTVFFFWLRYLPTDQPNEEGVSACACAHVRTCANGDVRQGPTVQHKHQLNSQTRVSLKARTDSRTFTPPRNRSHTQPAHTYTSLPHRMHNSTNRHSRTHARTYTSTWWPPGPAVPSSSAARRSR